MRVCCKYTSFRFKPFGLSKIHVDIQMSLTIRSCYSVVHLFKYLVDIHVYSSVYYNDLVLDQYTTLYVMDVQHWDKHCNLRVLILSSAPVGRRHSKSAVCGSPVPSKAQGVGMTVKGRRV